MAINEKMVFTAIDKTLKEQCAERPKHIPATVFNNSDEMSEQFTYIEKYYKRNLFRLTPAIRRQIKDMFKYAVIHNWVFNQKMAQKFNVKISDIQKTYNEYAHHKEYLTTLDNYQDFIGYLFQMALKSFKAEKQILEEFELLTSEEQENHKVPPRMWLEIEMVQSKNRIKEWKHSLKSMHEVFEIGMKVNPELVEQRKAIHKHISDEKQRLSSLTKRLKGKRPSGERKRYFYIERFRLIDLRDGAHTTHIVRMGSTSIVKSMLQEYCSWFNREHADEIRAHQHEVRKEKQRLVYEQRNREKLQEKKEKSMLLQQQVHQCMKKGLSLRKTATKLNVSYGSIRRASKEIEALIIAQ